MVWETSHMKFRGVTPILLAALLIASLVAIWLPIYRSRPQPPPQVYQHFGKEPHDHPVSRPEYNGQVDYNAR
jgi:hypothetical protein